MQEKEHQGRGFSKRKWCHEAGSEFATQEVGAVVGRGVVKEEWKDGVDPSCRNWRHKAEVTVLERVPASVAYMRLLPFLNRLRC